MSRDRHEETQELLPAYALGALDREEADLVAAHLEACPDCREELAAFEGVVGRLSQAAPDKTPPAGLKSAVMARVQSAAHTPARPLAPATPRGEGVSWQPGAFLQRTLPVWAALSAVLILALALGNILLWQQLQATRQQPNGMRTVALRGTEAAPRAAASIVIGTDGRQGALVVDDLPPLDTSRQYQLWLIDDGQRTSGGVFSVDDYGYGVIWVYSPRPLSEYSAFGVTVEPAGGSPGPTGVRVLGGGL